MPYSIEWEIPDRLIYITITGLVDLDDLKQIDDAMWEMIGSGMQPVHVIADVTALQKFPDRLVQLRDVYYRLDTTSTGWIMVITENPMVRLISSVIARFRRLRIRSVRTRSDALDFLETQDPTLSQLIAKSNQ
jgi:hypothetical protein